MQNFEEGSYYMNVYVGRKDKRTKHIDSYSCNIDKSSWNSRRHLTTLNRYVILSPCARRIYRIPTVVQNCVS